MSEEPKPCPCGGLVYVGSYKFIDATLWGIGCMHCGWTTGKTEAKSDAIAAWNRRASSTPPTTECEGDARKAAKRIVDWDDGGRLADDEWLVERNETAIIAICRALLSSPRVEEVRRMREALEACAAPWDSGPTTVPAVFPLLSAEFQRRLNIAGEVLVSLSLPDGEGDKQATRASGPTAPTDR